MPGRGVVAVHRRGRFSPGLAALLGSPRIPPLAFSLGAESARQRMIDMRGQMTASLPPIEGVKSHDVLVAGYADGDPEVTVRFYEPDDHKTSAALYWIHGGGMVAGSYDLDDYQSKLW